MPPHPKKENTSGNPVRDAIKVRDAVALLRLFTANDVSIHVHSALLPQIAFVCCDYKSSSNNSNNGQSKASKSDSASSASSAFAASSDEMETLVAIAGLCVLETFSAGTPKIATTATKATSDGALASSAAGLSAAARDFLRSFSIVTPHPSFRPHPLTEGVASLYLRLLAKVVSSSSDDGDDDGDSASSAQQQQPVAKRAVVNGCDLAAAYRALIQTLGATQSEQITQVAFATEMKKFHVRRRFFRPVLDVAAQMGLPLLCLEVMDSVANGDEEEGGGGGMGSLMASKMKSSISGGGGGGGEEEEEEDDHDVFVDDMSNNNNNNELDDSQDASPRAGKVRQREVVEKKEDDGDDNDQHHGSAKPVNSAAVAAAAAALLKKTNNSERIAAKNSHGAKNKKHEKGDPQQQPHQQQNSAAELCELWEADFALMVQSLTQSIRNNHNNNKKSSLDPRAFLDRVLSTLAVSHPLVGDKFRCAMLDLGAAVHASSASSCPLKSTFSVTDAAQVCLPVKQGADATTHHGAVVAIVHEQSIMETAPCTCLCCNVAVGGPAMELCAEQAKELATAIRDKLILPRLKERYVLPSGPLPARSRYNTVNNSGNGTGKFAPECLGAALERWQGFETLCRRALSPDMIIVDGANIGFYGLASWYGAAKRAVLERRGVPESQWDADELDSQSRRARGLSTDIGPSFSQINLAIERLHAQRPARGAAGFIVVLHARHLSERSVRENGNNAEMLEKWNRSCSSRNATGEEVQGGGGPKVVVVASPAEVNDDWCWMFLSLTFAARSYPSLTRQQHLFSSPNTNETHAAHPLALPVIVMTNDLMRDHISGLLPGKAEAGWKFLRYRWLHQVKCTFFFSGGYADKASKTALTRFPPRYHTWPVRAVVAADSANNSSSSSNSDDARQHQATLRWHIPFTTAVLLQGTNKTGLTEKPKQSANTKNADTAVEETSAAPVALSEPAEKQAVAMMPEQLLDMLAFAGAEAKGRLLCIKF